MSKTYKTFKIVRSNSNDPFIPEWWAKAGIAILEANMQAAQLVHRDFQEMLGQYGDVVNTRKPSTFTSIRKTDNDDVTDQDATATNVAVPLDQWLHVTFIIKDGEASKSFLDLVQQYLVPAMIAQAQIGDEIVLGQYPQFLAASGVGGGLGLMTSSNAKQYILETAQKLDEAKAPTMKRNLIVPPAMKTLILENAVFSEADKRGDMGSALREASLGRILGFDAYMCQNMASHTDSDMETSFQINNGAGYAAGTTGSMTVDTGSASIPVGAWVRILGQPYQVSAKTDTLGATTAITVTPATRQAFPDNTPVEVTNGGAVNNGAGYAAGWAKTITIDGVTKAPRRGQIITFGSDLTNKYTVVGTPSTTSIMLDRPLAAALVDDQVVNMGPGGSYALAFTREAIALVCRPLALPAPGTGARAAVFNHKGFSMRTVITYDGKSQGHRVTCDMLLGVKVLDTQYGAVLLG